MTAKKRWDYQRKDSLEDMFPPYDLWGEYYDINDLTEIIKHNKNEELVEF